MNISLVPAECNQGETILCPLSSEEFTMLRKEGLIAKRNRTYRMVLHHLEVQVECPVLLNGNRPAGVILPAFKLPYRPYPCYMSVGRVLVDTGFVHLTNFLNHSPVNSGDFFYLTYGEAVL